jgi:hypothetical protein
MTAQRRIIPKLAGARAKGHDRKHAFTQWRIIITDARCSKAPHAPRLHASDNALGARNNFPCIDSLRMQGNMHMNRREQPIPLPDEALYKHSG